MSNIDSRNLYSLFSIMSFRALKVTETLNELADHLLKDPNGISDKSYSTLLTLIYNVDENMTEDLKKNVVCVNGRYKLNGESNHQPEPPLA